MPRITPFLWFDRQAEEAARFYVSIFKNSRILGGEKFADVPEGPVRDVVTVAFELDGQPFVALNGGPQFKFTEAVSFVVDCENQQEIDEYWSKLLAGGGTESQCGWLKDRFGLSWQVVPRSMSRLLGGGDAAANQRAIQAMLRMKKLVIADLEAAARG